MSQNVAIYCSIGISAVKYFRQNMSHNKLQVSSSGFNVSVTLMHWVDFFLNKVKFKKKISQFFIFSLSCHQRKSEAALLISSSHTLSIVLDDNCKSYRKSYKEMT